MARLSGRGWERHGAYPRTPDYRPSGRVGTRLGGSARAGAGPGARSGCSRVNRRLQDILALPSRGYCLAMAQPARGSGTHDLPRAEPEWLKRLVGAPRSQRRRTFMVTTMLVIWALVGSIGVVVGLLTSSVGWGFAAALLACPVVWVALMAALVAWVGWAPAREALLTASKIARLSHSHLLPRLPPRG